MLLHCAFPRETLSANILERAVGIRREAKGRGGTRLRRYPKMFSKQIRISIEVRGPRRMT